MENKTMGLFAALIIFVIGLSIPAEVKAEECQAYMVNGSDLVCWQSDLKKLPEGAYLMIFVNQVQVVKEGKVLSIHYRGGEANLQEFLETLPYK